MYSTMSSEQEMLRDSVRRFMKSEVAPTVAQHDKDKTFPFELLKELSQFGYIGGRLPEALGGMDMDQMTWAMLMEEAGYTWLSLRTMVNITNAAINKLAAEANEEQRERFLKPLLASERKVFNAISEPSTGSNIAQVQTRADLQGDHYMLMGLDGARVNIAMGAVGAAQAALDLSIDYARTRTQFGKPIGSFQLVQKLIVDMTIRVEAARALSLRAAAALDANADARTACSIAKLYATEAAHEVASMALQVHGGLGYATDYPIERIFRDTRGGTIPEGTTEVQTLIAGREILGISAIV